MCGNEQRVVIMGCSDPLAWFAGEEHDSYKLEGSCDKGYLVRAPDGVIRTVPFRDGVVVRLREGTES